MGGADGLDRPVHYVTVMDAPGGDQWIKGHEFILTTAYFLRNDESLQEKLLPNLNRLGVSALGIKPRRFLDRIPEVMIEQANLLSMPLIELPYAVAWVDVINPILNEVLDRQITVLERSREVHRRFIRLVLDGRSLDDIAQDLACLVNRPVMITDKTFHRLAVYSPHTDGGPACAGAPEISPHVLAAAWAEGRPAGFEISGDVRRSGDVILAPVMIRNSTYGYVVVFGGPDPLPETDLMAVEQAATVCALDTMQRMASEEVERRFRNSFIEDLVMGNFECRQAMIRRGEAFDWDLTKPHVVMVADIDGFERYYVETSNYDDHAMRVLKDRFLRILNSTQAISGKRLLGADRSDSIILLLPVEPGAEPQVSDNMARTMAEAIRAEAAKRLSPLTVSLGISRVAEDLGTLPRAYRESTEAMALGRKVFGPGRVTHYNDLGIFRVLCGHNRTNEQRKFHTEWIAPLADYDARHGTDLLGTLDAFFQCNMNASAAAAKLYIHENTLRYRLRKVGELIGVDIFSGETLLNLWAGLKLHTVFASDQPADTSGRRTAAD
jgi:purine catabolism regulator